MHVERTLVRAIVAAGASGYIPKDDRAAIEDLGTIVRLLVKGGIFFGQQVRPHLGEPRPKEQGTALSVRQLEVLSLAAAYPNETTSDIARRMGIANSTVRNLLSTAYIHLGVNNRSAALAKAWQMKLIVPPSPADSPLAPGT
jgi:DNA-binding NarL/FixJ family response regulator